MKSEECVRKRRVEFLPIISLGYKSNNNEHGDLDDDDGDDDDDNDDNDDNDGW